MNPYQKIAAERSRQVLEEGYTADKDDQWVRGELALAAWCYELVASAVTGTQKASHFATACDTWPFGSSTGEVLRAFKPLDANGSIDVERCLIKAAALLRAEKARLNRAEQRIIKLLTKETA